MGERAGTASRSDRLLQVVTPSDCTEFGIEDAGAAYTLAVQLLDAGQRVSIRNLDGGFEERDPIIRAKLKQLQRFNLL